MIRSRHIALLSLTLACAGAVMLSNPSTAFAQDQATIDKLVQMNKKALDDYDTLDWDAAKQILLNAIMAGKKAGLDNHPIMARTYVHLGAVYLTGFKMKQKAMQSFARALEIDPTIQLSKGIDTSDVTAAFSEAQRKAKGGGASGGDDDGAPPPPKKRRGPIMEGDAPAPSRTKHASSDDDDGDEPDLPVRINALDCPIPDDAIIDKPVVLRCALSPSLPVASVHLLYRAPDKDTYNEVVMTKTPKGWLQGKIPKKAVTGKSLQFYFEGRNSTGKPVVANGGADSPNILLLVEEGAKEEVSSAGTHEEDENPLEDNEGDQRPRLHLGHIDKEREGLDTRYGKRKWWIGISIGTGYGYAKGNGFEAVNKSTETKCVIVGCTPFHSLQNEFQPGLAWAGLGQLAPEVGYQINPDMAVSLEGRLQYIGQPSEFSKFGATGAIAVLGKLSFFTKQSQLRFFGTVLAGGGDFRFIVYPDATHPTFKDTILGGPIVAGVGGGLYYEASKPVSLVVQLHALVGAPTVSAVVDVNAGLQFNIY
ncbi:MAG TPA: tetratricopeptide repeat protein [Polyangia bacterium]|nr:tetratricopeptide repeat protein [Polyangia bacterium]HVZ88368.1 tetratricopeptide repeat protein [Polyangia bacterium]